MFVARQRLFALRFKTSLSCKTFSSHEKSLSKMRDVWHFWKRNILIMKTMSVVLGSAAAATWIWNFAGKKELVLPSFNELSDRIVREFEQGNGYQTFQSSDVDAKIPRDNLHANLAKILSPKSMDVADVRYFFIVGESGSGKSTAIRQVMGSLKEPRGVYIHCPQQSQEFSFELAKLIGFEAVVESNSPKETSMNEPLETFAELTPSLLDAAHKFCAKHGRPMVLVIDDVEILAKQQPRFFERLLNEARHATNLRVLRFVFVSSDSSVLFQAMSYSAWTRGNYFEIGEIEDEEAIEYLKDKKIPEDVAKEAVLSLTGGLFALLDQFVSLYGRGIGLPDQIKIKEDFVKEVLGKLGVSPTHESFQSLLNNQAIPITDLNLPLDVRNSLVQHNILTIHPDRKSTFHDRGVEKYFKQVNWNKGFTFSNFLFNFIKKQ